MRKEFLSCAEHTLSTLDEGITTLHRNARGEGLIRIGMLRPLGIEYIPRLAAGFLKANPGQDIQFTFHTGVTQYLLDGLAARKYDLVPLGIEYIPRLAAGFLKANPGQDIQFTFHTGVTQYLLDGLAARKYDLVFCSQPSEEHKFTAVPIQKQNLIMITPQSHPLSAKDSVDLVETIPYPQIFFEKSAGIRNVIDQMFARTGASPKIAYETEEDQVIAGLVAQGFGIAVVPYMDILQKLNVNILQIRSPNYERAFFMVHNDCVFIPPVVQKFRQFVLDDDVIDQMFARTGASPKIAYETEEDQVIAGLVAQGFGIAVVPYMDILQKLNVNILQIRSPNYERAFFMVHNDCVFMPPVVQKFRQFVLDDGMMLTKEPVNILQIRSPNYERAFFMVHNDCVFMPPVVQKFRQFVLDDGMMLTKEPA